ISGDPDTAAAELRDVCDGAGLDLTAELDAFEQRTGFLAARGVDVTAIRFATAFARNLDYYTGFIFEMHDPDSKAIKPFAGGGRYDGLLQRLGAKAPVPAVGASIWLDRVAVAGARS
ncbi:MAG: ATP phosphoribosyltransferase regulatory subunit, partial [Bosea sp. (in: a-proteobacteria)]